MIYSVSRGELFPSDSELAVICTDECVNSLENLKLSQRRYCSASDWILQDGQYYPPTFITDNLLFTYNYTCIRDPKSRAYCAPLMDEYNSKENPTSEELCSDCNLLSQQAQLNSPFGWDDEFEESYASLTKSCGVTSYPVTSPSPYTISISTTSAPVPSTPSTLDVTCVSMYTIQPEDTCESVVISQRVSTFWLMYANNLPAYCTGFPKAGTKLCIPPQCNTYKGLRGDSCDGIARFYGNKFTQEDLMKWNPNLSEKCKNVRKLADSRICVSPPGDTAVLTSAKPIPTSTSPLAYLGTSPKQNLDFYFTINKINHSDTCSHFHSDRITATCCRHPGGLYTLPQLHRESLHEKSVG
ncbi:LysM domain-containing protein [Colletotrichum higginsianum]|uniref:LysM domain-containing protein n=1 Tax=Colletotrichum higginsianum (strain IMI 349063) TaxID=759273 RepID=H1UZ34_COLHI|nr:LysM domain-containing protein [Colletotrichum higginsianum IMI 349063]OBR14989.1 LysM domain-containing protein [Colletotrichum higginsianum IMI 349063]CCF33235.1 LysM domain-containing protein [Colletotrichum higginsianum]